MGANLPFSSAPTERLSSRSTTTGLKGDDMVVVILLILGWLAATVALLGSVAHNATSFPTH